ncbi:uncharacterized protein LOC108625701 [Ceratina calcarata]|uniref:Uncharacterized protein LOC108625701 n=1 Tax=Ceratina calcarata TaxID=156304 RepID=A0AAJ7J063_9HYME|nr:uncharacterized protein LOC108625701 [Ceratina calcarata]
MCDTLHPSYYHIEKLGCVDPIKIATAFHVYIELCEVRRYWDINYKYNEQLDLLYLEGKRSKNSQVELFIPWLASSNVSLDKIEKIQDGLNVEQVTFVFKAADSTSVMYRASKGLVKPTAPELTKLIKEKEEKKLNLEKEIRKNTSHLYELAKSLTTENVDKDAGTAVCVEDETNK